MKQKDDASQPVTKDYFDESLKKYATKADLDESLKKYSTKTDLRNVEKSLRSELLRLEEQMEKMEDRIDKNAKGYRDEVLTKLDGVMGELQTMREENIVGTYHTSEIKEQVDGHEKKRIARLEQTRQAA